MRLVCQKRGGIDVVERYAAEVLAQTSMNFVRMLRIEYEASLDGFESPGIGIDDECNVLQDVRLLDQ